MGVKVEIDLELEIDFIYAYQMVGRPRPPSISPHPTVTRQGGCSGGGDPLEKGGDSSGALPAPATLVSPGLFMWEAPAYSMASLGIWR